jgi:mono/diheme cytochrome c family protein
MGLDDQQTADVLTYVRSHFGNTASAISADQVKAIRQQTAARSTFWNSGELKKE